MRLPWQRRPRPVAVIGQQMAAAIDAEREMKDWPLAASGS